LGQEGFGNDAKSYGFVQCGYELISNHVNPFQIKLHDFQTLVLDEVEGFFSPPKED